MVLVSWNFDEAFGEVSAENLTKCWPENREIVVVRGFSWAFGEFWNPNLTKYPKIP